MTDLLRCVLALLITACNGQGIGRVFIGQRGVATTPFTFTESSTTASIPVYIDAFNATNLTLTVPVVGNVSVTCEVIIQQSGYTNSAFSSIRASNSNKDGTITLSNFVAGRQNSVQCYGLSSRGGVTQFTRVVSRSDAVPITINSVPSFTLYPSQITTETTSFSVLLLLSAPASTGTVGIRCQANKLNTTVEVNQALQNPVCFTTTSATNTTTAPSAATPANSTDNVTTTLATPGPTDATIVPSWGILQPLLQLDTSSNQYSAVLKVVRNLPVTYTSREYVVISCCSDNLGINISDTVLAVALLKRNVTVNWDQATDTVSGDTERTIQNPAYLEVAPCACDLTGNLCDIGCCCDADCDNLKSVFTSCIPGLVGGQGAPTADYNCYSDHFNKEDWFHLMCVEREYNSLLGYFHSTESALRQAETFNEKVLGEEYYSYREAEERSQSYNSFGRVGYRYGTAVQSVRMDANNANAELIGIVGLPQKVLSGECLPIAPVQYLKDVKTDCTFQLTQDLCSVTGVFNSFFYVQSTNASNPAYSGSYGILDTPINQKIAAVDVKYYCTTDFNGYIKSTSSATSSRTGNYTFNYTLPTGNCADSCGNDICTSQDSSVQTSLPPRCQWDDGLTLPPEVSYNTNSNTCDNAVIDVKYVIYWTGTEITKLDAVVILGNIPLATSPVITQKYETVFTHDFSGNTTTFDNYLGLNTTYTRSGSPVLRNPIGCDKECLMLVNAFLFFSVHTLSLVHQIRICDVGECILVLQCTYTRSGSPGYDFEKPIWSGTPVYNSTTNQFIRINTNSARQMAVWNTGIDGLCFNAGRRTIMFGEDTFTTCDLRLGLYEFSDCNKLRRLIINRVNNLMAAVYIGRYGYNDPANINYWIDVQREDLTDICIGNYNETDEDILTYTMTGICTNIITGINLDIMYAETGKRNGNPIHEIIGAYISYPKSTWKLSCTAGGACSSTTGYVESFAVTSSVQFTKVPGNTPARLEKWEEDYDRSLCGQDICWEELIYPLSSSYTAEDKNYVLAVTLVTIIIFIGFILMTRPWW